MSKKYVVAIHSFWSHKFRVYAGHDGKRNTWCDPFDEHRMSFCSKSSATRAAKRLKNRGYYATKVRVMVDDLR